MSATALFLVYPVFGDHRFNRWNIDFLSTSNKLTGNSANIFSATFTIFRSMFNGVMNAKSCRCVLLEMRAISEAV